MEIYYIEYGIIMSKIDEVGNLEQLQRELDNQYEYWSEDRGDIECELAENKEK